MKNKIISIIVIMILSICLMVQIVNASSLTVTMKQSSSSVQEATEFTVKVSVSNLDVGDNGINSLSGKLTYDSDVFETISESSIEGLNKWNAEFDDATGVIKLTKNTFVKTSQEVFQIVFKTKSGVSGKSGAISFADIVALNSEEEISASPVSVSISVTENDGSSSGSKSSSNNTTNNTVSIVANTSSNDTSNNSSNTSNNSTNNASNNTANSTYNNTDNSNSSSNGSSSSGNSSYVNTTSDDDMPRTGVSDTLVSLILVGIVVALVFYIKIEKINKDFK